MKFGRRMFYIFSSVFALILFGGISTTSAQVLSPGISVEKTTSFTGSADIGDVIPYTITVGNTLETDALTNINVSVDDPLVPNLQGPIGDVNGNNKLETSETWTYTGNYTVVESDICKQLINVATAVAQWDADCNNPTRSESSVMVPTVCYGSISGFNFNDLNDNTQKDPDEPGLENWTIFLDENSNGILDDSEQSAITSVDGSYLFNKIPLGDYRVCEVLKDGWVQSSASSKCYDVSVGVTNRNITDQNFGNFQTTSVLSGYVYSDKNGNGIWDEGEIALNDWEVCNGESCVLTGQGDWQDGYYEFSNLAAGTYTLTETLQDGWEQTQIPSTVTITAGENVSNLNFGNKSDIAISGYVYNDFDQNGNLTSGDLALQGWKISLSSKDGQLIDSTQSDENGYYSFQNIEPGDYTLEEETQDGWIPISTFAVELLGLTKDQAIDFFNYPFPVVNVEKVSDTTTFVNPGDKVDYTIGVSNIGAGPALDFTVQDNLPPGFSYVEGSSVISPDMNVSEPTISDNVLIWTIDRLDPHQSLIITYQALIDAGIPAGIYKNSASAMGKSDEYDVEVRAPMVLGEATQRETIEAAYITTGNSIESLFLLSFLSTIFLYFFGLKFKRRELFTYKILKPSFKEGFRIGKNLKTYAIKSIIIFMTQFIADFHIHSKYSRATSKNMDLEDLDSWAKIKGIQVLGTGDFTHPEWFKNLKEKLEPAEQGLFKLRDSNSDVRFILTVEVSCIYSKNGKVRKIHHLIFAPDFKTVEKINTQLSWSGNLKADGRPTFGMDSIELLKVVLDSSPDCLLVPAHAWTPWFGVFGSKSGFDSLEECFEELMPHIFAIETGLSSDPPMNWRLSALDNITLISNSDAHSCPKLGREANIFEGEELNYKTLVEAIKKGKRIENNALLKLVSTIEFFPEEGKYHFDGHRACQVRLSPEERKKYGGICPNCGKPLTVGVLSRVDTLADRPEGTVSPNALPYFSLVPLNEIIGKTLSKESYTKEVMEEYQKLISAFGSEFKVLIETPIEKIANISPRVADAIKKVREGKINVIPGFDGEFGKVQIFEELLEETKKPNQQTLF